MLDIGGIGNHKIDYKNHENIEFLSLEEYITMAKKMISKLSNGLNKKFLNSEDVISYVANAIMMADWRWDNNYKSKEGRNKGLYSYRNQCAIWAIKTLTSKKLKQNYYYLEESISDSDNRNNLNFVEDEKTLDPSIIYEESERLSNIREDVNSLINSSILNDKQKEYLKLYYFDGLTLEKIGKKYGVTREAVRQNINKSILKLRKEILNV